MRRLAALVVVLLVVPASSATATELDELLGQGREASYSAEQIISCSTPDGVRDAVVRIAQSGGELRVSSSVDDDVEVNAGAGGWTATRRGGLVAEAAVDSGREKTEPLYVVEDQGSVVFLGREAMAYRLVRDGEVRAELVLDDDTGALVQVVTFGLEDEVYCERRFVSFDAAPPVLGVRPFVELTSRLPTPVEDSDLPLEVVGFERLDHYEDAFGFRFAYYSDGFFSFALFETPLRVILPEATTVELESGAYDRSFSAGQVTYVWETDDGGMALVGDLPPDLHEAVLTTMPHPDTPNFLRRWWRALFG